MPRTRPERLASNTSDEWTKSGSFINKPPRGWLHPDQIIAGDGMRYSVRYVGSIGVNASMKSLDFDTRSLVAKECINRVCEAACLKNSDRRRKIDKRLVSVLAESPNMTDAGANVNLVVTSSRLNLIILESGKIIASHDMPNISFASGGDANTLDFIAYVAKDHRSGRSCYVVECGAALAQDVITTIGQAFELRFKQFLRRTNPPGASSHHNHPSSTKNDYPPGNNGLSASSLMPSEDPEYYNDLPGKVPPDFQPPLPPLPDYSAAVSQEWNGASRSGSHLTPALVSGNLIDLGTEITDGMNAASPKAPEPEYVNSMVCANEVRDPFDMQPFEQSISQTTIPAPPPHRKSANIPSSGGVKRKTQGVSSDLSESVLETPESEEWYHGAISRKDSENLVVKDGDFLVREAQGSSRQYVLTGMQGGLRKHLLLVDPEGIVRTKDRTFESISHLVNYHFDNGLPIISVESALVLRHPVPKDRLV